MRKTTLLLAIFALLAIKAYSQNASATAAQQTNLTLANAIVISFTTSGSSSMNISFTDQNQMNNGVETMTHQVLVQSNLPYDVVMTTPTNFSYSGGFTSNTTMPVFDKFKMKITDNSTGGTNVLGNGYTDVTGTSTQLFANCPASGDATFDIKYKLKPTSAYAPGIYTMNILYTATQL